MGASFRTCPGDRYSVFCSNGHEVDAIRPVNLGAEG
jgi:hypothetical protein